MAIYLLDDTLKVEVFFEQKDTGFPDNVCVCFVEDCPKEEKVLSADQVNIYLTRRQARQLALALLNAAEESDLAVEND